LELPQTQKNPQQCKIRHFLEVLFRKERFLALTPVNGLLYPTHEYSIRDRDAFNYLLTCVKLHRDLLFVTIFYHTVCSELKEEKHGLPQHALSEM